MMAQKGKTKISRVISPTKIPKQKNNGETLILSGHAGVNNSEFPLEKSLRSSYGIIWDVANRIDSPTCEGSYWTINDA